MSSTRAFSSILSGLGLLVIGMIFLAPTVLAASYQDLSPGLEAAARCKDPNTCIGSCSCGLKVNVPLTLSSFWSKDIAFTVYDQVSADLNVLVLRVTDNAVVTKPYGYQTQLIFTSSSCGVILSPIALGGSDSNYSLQKANDQIKPLYGSQFCKYNDPFCCCTDGGGGHFADCKRGVEYSDPLRAPQPTCQSFGDKYKPITDAAFPKYASLLQKGGGCKLFLEAANRDQDKKKDLSQTPYEVPTQSNINLLDEARSLNQTRFTTLTQVIGQVIKLLLAFIGSIALALYIWSGILWMTAAGSSERIQQAKGILIWTTLGVVMMLTSALVVSFIFGILTN